MEDDRDLLLIAIFTFVTVSLWIFFELINTAKTTTVTSSTQEVLTPINPDIDTDVFNTLNERVTYK